MELASSLGCISKLCACGRWERSGYSQRSIRQVISSDWRVAPTNSSTRCIKNCSDCGAFQSGRLPIADSHRGSLNSSPLLLKASTTPSVKRISASCGANSIVPVSYVASGEIPNGIPPPSHPPLPPPRPPPSLPLSPPLLPPLSHLHFPSINAP